MWPRVGIRGRLSIGRQSNNPPVRGREVQGLNLRAGIRRMVLATRPALFLPFPAALRAYVTDKSWHGYGRPYGRHLRRFRWRRITFFEIGLYDGGSLRLWRDAFPRARITGLDTSPPDVRLGRRVTVCRGDQASSADLERALDGLPAPTVVVDDGSHRGKDIWASFRHLFPRLKRGGVYVIEDLSTSYWPKWDGSVPAPHISGIGLIRDLIDAVQQNAPVYRVMPEAGDPPPSEFSGVRAVHVYPDMVVIEKE
jgi:hypothetical protein